MLMPLHNHGTLRFPDDDDNDDCGMLVECSGPVVFRADENRMTLNYSAFYFTADYVAPVVRLSKQSAVNILNNLHLIRTQDEAGGMYECTGMRPPCFETFAYHLTWNSFVEPI